MSGTRLSAMLVDDEGPSRRRLRRMLEQIPGVDVLADEADPIEALARIAELAPDVVFLDIHMPGIDGLTLAERCARVPAIVFVTAHAEHAVRAFDLASVDYLLKPVRIERLEEAVGRVRSRQDRPTEASGSSSAARPGEDAPPRVIAYERGTKVFVDATTITRFRASDKYTAFVSEQRELLTEEPLVALEERLGGLGFVRVHRAELIRLSAVRSFRVEDGAHSVCLKDGQIVPVSRRMAASLRARLGL